MNPADLQLSMPRKYWMSVLAQANADALASVCECLGALPRTQWLRPPETGLVMVRGRVGGSGAKFNLGEMPVTRCALRLDSGVVGIAWVQGRDAHHAEWAARLDALLQEPLYHEQIRRQIIEPLAAARAARRDGIARKAATTKVDFYTLARETLATNTVATGEDK